MPQSLSRVCLHLIFSTKERRAFLGEVGLGGEMHSVMSGILKDLGCVPIEVGGVADHVHLLFGMSRTKSIAEVVKEVKRLSSSWAKERDSSLEKFAWQSGYGVFSVSQSGVSQVIDYIRRQEEHHRTMSFQDEFRSFLRKHGVEFDERYVWE